MAVSLRDMSKESVTLCEMGLPAFLPARGTRARATSILILYAFQTITFSSYLSRSSRFGHTRKKTLCRFPSFLQVFLAF